MKELNSGTLPLSAIEAMTGATVRVPVVDATPCLWAPWHHVMYGACTGCGASGGVH